MTKQEIQQLPLGLYIVVWKKERGGGLSLAAVGQRGNGDRWFSPTNWVTPDADMADHCQDIEKVVLLATR